MSGCGVDFVRAPGRWFIFAAVMINHLNMKLRYFLALALVFLTATDSRAQWQQLSYQGQAVQDFAFLGNNVFGATEGGIIISTDGGGTWSILETGIEPTAATYTITAVGNTLLAGTKYAGIHRSEDGGQTWTASHTGVNVQPVVDFVHLNGTILAATELFGIYRSTDNGLSWASSFSQKVLDMTTHGSTAYMTTSDQAYVSNDLGATWMPLGAQLPSKSLYNISLTEAGDVFVSSNGGQGVFRLSADKSSWTEVNNGLGNATTFYTMTAIGNELFGGTMGVGVFRSTDCGDNWIEDNEGLGIFSKIIQSFGYSNGKLYVGTISGLYSKTLSGAGVAVVTDAVELLYPNPSRGAVQIDVSSDDVREITVLDQLGKNVYTLAISGAGSYTLDLASLPSGMYMVRVGRSHSKLVLSTE